MPSVLIYVSVKVILEKIQPRQHDGSAVRAKLMRKEVTRVKPKKRKSPKVKVNTTGPVAESKPTIVLEVRNALFVKNIRGVLAGKFRLGQHDWKMVDLKAGDIYLPEKNLFVTDPNREREFSELPADKQLFELILADGTKHILKGYTERDSECITAAIGTQMHNDSLVALDPGRTSFI